MKVKLNQVEIRTNATTQVVKLVGAYEVPILKAVHGKESVMDRGAAGDFRIASVEEEVERLCILYGRERMESLYGKLLSGLVESIKAAEVPAKTSGAQK